MNFPGSLGTVSELLNNQLIMLWMSLAEWLLTPSLPATICIYLSCTVKRVKNVKECKSEQNWWSVLITWNKATCRQVLNTMGAFRFWLTWFSDFVMPSVSMGPDHARIKSSSYKTSCIFYQLCLLKKRKKCNLHMWEKLIVLLFI